MTSYPDSIGPAFRLISEESVNLARCTIVGNDCEPFVVHVQDKILALIGKLRNVKNAKDVG